MISITKQRLLDRRVLLGSAVMIVALVAGVSILNWDNDDQKSWSVTFHGIGTGSSPRMADLNGDGTLDMVMGVGGKENHPSDTGVIALNGVNGKLLWHVVCFNQIVGSAIFMDITQDGTPDVFIGGRSAELMAIDGRLGTVLWRFFSHRGGVNPADSGWFNFFNPQLIADQDRDGLQDLLIANGGNYLVPPHDPNRPTGNLLVISSMNGKILAKAPVPDGRETYSSVIQTDLHHNGNPVIVFGTGGETIGGHLYRTTLKDLMKGDISKATVLATSQQKGFIAPAVFVDVTQDGVYDVIANAVDGRMLAINGANDQLVWEVSIPATEAYSSPAVGNFNGDAIPDFFANFGIGVWPAIQQSVLLMVDGKSGAIKFRDTLGGFQYASAITADLNHDQYDECIVSVNEKTLGNRALANTHLHVFNFRNGTQYSMGDTLVGSNIASTPWIGDINDDGILEIIYSAVISLTVSNDIDNPDGLQVNLVETSTKTNHPISWGAYMGSLYNGVYHKGNSDQAVE